MFISKNNNMLPNPLIELYLFVAGMELRNYVELGRKGRRYMENLTVDIDLPNKTRTKNYDGDSNNVGPTCHTLYGGIRIDQDIRYDVATWQM
ncbi:hypothetical protein RND71_020506 [Anisodus tanguticus]|uniref:Uncharacterized protein n=1 Tax=Anisodus tanguticus TaxID=243964 RepID=A0AAE1VHM9_9SOLA|nr:hypothetical protein RND71_020506 [Anisodus tanguticus]